MLRASIREPQSVIALFAEFDSCSAVAPLQYKCTVDALRAALIGRSAEQLKELEGGARALVDTLAICLQASTLLQHGDSEVADAFIATRFCKARDGLLTVHNMGAVTGSTLSADVITKLLVRLDVQQV